MGSVREVVQPNLPSGAVYSDPAKEAAASLDALSQRPLQYEALVTEVSRRKDMTPLQAQQRWPRLKADPEVADLYAKRYTRAEVKDVLFPNSDYDNISSWATRRQIMEEPESDFLGFTSLGKDFVKGLGRIAIETPTYLGNLIEQTGDVQSAVNDFLFKDNPKLRDAVTKAMIITPITPAMGATKGSDLQKAGKSLIKANQEFLSDMNIQPEDSAANRFAFDLGSGFGSAALALGLAYSGRPDAAIALFGLIQEGSVYKEAREAGLNPFAATGVGVIAGGAEAYLEKVGLDIWVRRLRGQKTFTRIFFRMGTEGFQEGSQQASEEIITKLSGIRDVDWNEVLERSAYAASIGLIVGGGLGSVTTMLENSGLLGELREAGLSDEEASIVINEVAEEVKKETNRQYKQIIEEETGKTTDEKLHGEEAVPNGEEVVPEEPDGIYSETEGIEIPVVPKGAKVVSEPAEDISIEVTEEEVTEAAPTTKERANVSDEEFETLAFAEDPNASQRMPVELETPAGEVPTIAVHKVIKEMTAIPAAIDKLVVIKVGKVSKRARGQFNTHTHVIRLKVANNIPTASHEVGHAMEEVIFPMVKEHKAKDLMMKELRDLGMALYGAREPHNGYESEGVAEYHRYFLTNPKVAAKKAPNFHKFFVHELLADKNNAELKKTYDKTRRSIQTFQRQGAINRARKGIFKATSAEERIEVAKTALFDKETLIQQHIEMLYPLKQLEERARKILGRELNLSESPYMTAKARRLTFTAVVDQMVKRGMVDIRGQVTGRALEDILMPIKGRREDFTIYLWARRALSLWKDPNGARNPGLSREDAEQILSELESPAFQIAAEQLYEWEDQVLHYVGQSSPVFNKVIEAIRKRDPGNYIPLKRHFDDLTFRYAEVASKPVAFTGKLSSRLKGSGRRITDPFNQIIQDTTEKIRAAHTRMVLDQIINLSRVPGMGAIIEKVPKSMVAALNRPVVEVLNTVDKQLRKKGIALDLKKGGVTEEEVAEALAESITFFMPAQSPKAGETIIPVLNPGTQKIEWFEVRSDLFESLMSLDTISFNNTKGINTLLHVMSAVAKSFRFGTTGVRLAFGLVTNPIRDFETFMVNTRSHANGLTMFAAWINQMVRAAVVPFGAKATPEMEFYMKLGGQMAQQLGQDINFTERSIRGLFQGRFTKTMDPRNWIDFVRDLIQFPESATRSAEIQLMAKEMGLDLSQPISVEEAHRLLLAGKEVSTDFTAAGEVARMWNQLVPFYNASIQGPRANIRAFNKNPTGFIFRVLTTITIPSLMLWWKNKDEDWYQELGDEERALFWYVKVQINGQDELVRIPRAFDVGAAFGSVPEGLIDAAYRQKPEQVVDTFGAFFKSTAPIPSPQALTIVLEQAVNRNFFWDTPIVSQSLEKLAPEEQFDEFTSRAAIETAMLVSSIPILSETVFASPKRLDHLIYSTFGGASRDVLSTIGLGSEDLAKEKELADLPIIGTVFQRGGTSGIRSQSVSKMYDKLTNATQLQRSIIREESPEQRQMRLMLTDASRAVSGIFYVRSRTKSDRERRELSTLATEIARDANEIFDSGKVSTAQRNKLKKTKKKFQLQKSKLKERREQQLRKNK